MPGTRQQQTVEEEATQARKVSARGRGVPNPAQTGRPHPAAHCRADQTPHTARRSLSGKEEGVTAPSHRMYVMRHHRSRGRVKPLAIINPQVCNRPSPFLSGHLH